MTILLLFLLFPFFTNSLNYYRLSTLGQQSLKSNDYVYSTIGYFRFSLQSTSCQIKIEFFDENSNSSVYKTVGYYPKNTPFQCQGLILQQNGLFNENLTSIFSFESSNKTLNNQIKNVRETFVTIDDTGVLRLQSILIDQTTRQKWIISFRNPQKTLTSSNNKIISNESTLSLIKNNGDWGFSASKGQFRIFHLNEKTKNSRYKFLPFILSTNTFKDWSDFTTPLLNFDGLRYQKRCGVSKEVSFRSPFVFSINRYWPQLRILDQQGYELFNMRYPSINCYRDIGVDTINDYQDCISWFCPPQTFELNGKCFAKCPKPYFHQIKQNKKNRCVLICQLGSYIDNETNICTCTQKHEFICPYNLTSTPLGCLCKNETYFFTLSMDKSLNNRNLNEVCLQNCPARYYQHTQGICVSCPMFCLQCVASNTSTTFLKCLQCQEGYEIFTSYCKKKCELFVGYFLNQTSYKCEKCQISNCQRCQSLQGKQACRQCILPYTLFNNTCLNSCPKNFILNFVKDKSFQCDPIIDCNSLVINQKATKIQRCQNCGRQFCFQSCDNNLFQYFHNKSACFCNNYTAKGPIASYEPYCNFSQENDKKNSVNFDNFLSKQMNHCPIIHYYFNFRTNECFKCPFGCLTCIVDQKGLPECTSCVQNYYLSVYDTNYCQKQTSLAFCYSFNRIQKYCFSWDSINDLLEKDVSYSLCKEINPNCFICLYHSSVYCKFCQNQYYLHEGKCIKQCPEGHYPYKYQHVCLPNTIDKCLEESVQSVNYLVNVNPNSQYIEGYRYFTSKYFTQIQNQNDPVGLIFVYYGILKRRIDGQRMTTFSKSSPICKLCQQGYGITLLGTCQKCSQHCLVCIYSYILSCLKCHPFYYITNKGQCLPLQQSKRPCLKDQFRYQNGTCHDSCDQFRKILSNKVVFDPNQKVINCTYNCPESMLIMKNQNRNLICIDKSLANKSSEELKLYTQIPVGSMIEVKTKQIKILSSCYYSEQKSGHCVIIPTAKIQNLTQNAFYLKMMSTSSGRLLQNLEQISVKIQQDSLLIKNIQAGVLKVVFSVQKYSNKQTNQFLANSCYGFEIRQNYSLLDYILQNDRGMHYYSRIFTVVFLLIAVINFGKGLDYKLDNIFITMGVVYLALTGFNLNFEKGSNTLYGFMYGFSWSLGLQLFSNPRYLTLHSQFFDNYYIQKVPNNAHSLLFIDDNFLRNCWSIFILFFIIVGLLIFSWLLIKLLTGKLLNKYKLLSINDQTDSESNQHLKSTQNDFQSNKFETKILRFNCLKEFPQKDLDHFPKIKSFSLFVIQNCILSLFYYTLLQMSSSQYQLAQNPKLAGHKILAIIFFIIILGYSILRGYTNFFAGIYLFKRISMAFILFIYPTSQGFLGLFLGLLMIQLIFTCFRIVLECPEQYHNILAHLSQTLSKVKNKGSDLKQSTQTDILPPQKRDDEKQEDEKKNDQPFQLQKGMIDNNLLTLPEQSFANKSQRKQTNLVRESEMQNANQAKQSLWRKISKQMKLLLAEQILIILIYLMIALNGIGSGSQSVIAIIVIFLVFLVTLLDQLILNIIEYTEITTKKIVNEENSLLSQIHNKLSEYQSKYFFKIRNNFDFQRESKTSIHSQNSSIYARQRKSSINLSYVTSNL